MTSLLRNRKALAFITATVGCAALALALAYPKPVSNPLLGGGWRCSRIAFLTSCTRIDRSAPLADSLGAGPTASRSM